MIYLIKLLLVVVAGLFNACMDTLSQSRYILSIFARWKIFAKHKQFWDPNVSWKNKYKNGDYEQGPRFFGSTGFLVFLTDGWHLTKTSMLVCLSIAIGIEGIAISTSVDWFIYWTLFGCSFSLFYKVLWKRQ